MDISIPVSIGELVDKITILEIKAERIADAEKRANVARELDALQAVWRSAALSEEAIAAERAQLREVNEALWEIEDRIRLKESQGAFDADFIELARAVYVTNDRRARLKREINRKLGSALIEEKSYADYA